MNQDIDRALQDWEFKPGPPQVRLVQAADGRTVIQMRHDLGVLQMELADRPDGTRPHGCPTYFDYLRQQASRSSGDFCLSDDQCAEADREFIQFYHRRICWLALGKFAQAVSDADHTLAFMDFVGEHSPSEDYTLAHEHYRGFVNFHRAHAAASQAMEKDDPKGALDAIHEGLERLRTFFASHDAEEQMEENVMVQQLRKMDHTLRQSHKIEPTLQEQLEQAVANEEYEIAAKLRDAMRKEQQQL